MNQKQKNIAIAEAVAGNQANLMRDLAAIPYCVICIGPLLPRSYFQAQKPIYATKVIPCVHPENLFHINQKRCTVSCKPSSKPQFEAYAVLAFQQN